MFIDTNEAQILTTKYFKDFKMINFKKMDDKDFVFINKNLSEKDDKEFSNFPLSLFKPMQPLKSVSL